MTNPKPNGRLLWFGLLGLGFQPDSGPSVTGKTNLKHLNLGPNMFDRPNKEAFYVITHFLLNRLNPTRFRESYRFCWPVLGQKADAEFRKVTCSWLREIMDDRANPGSKVLPSLLLSPGGPRFTSMMLNLANHVMLQEMKTFSTEDTWVPEAAATPASSLDMAEKRWELVRRRFLRTAVEQDQFLQDYQRKAQLLVKSMKELRAEASQYDQLLRRAGDGPSPGGAAVAEKVNQVRSLWSTVDAAVSGIKAQQEGVESVLRGEVDQYVLDGTGRVLTVPRSLQEHVERQPQLSSGRLYSSGQLHLLRLLELLLHSLQVLREEQRRLPAAARFHLGPAQLQGRRGQMSRALQSLQLIRQKVSREGTPEARSRIRELEASWDRKWSQSLQERPPEEEQAVGFLSPMAPLCFEPPAEPGWSLFSQFAAVLPKEGRAEAKPQEAETSAGVSSFSPDAAEVPGDAVATEPAPPRANTSLDWLFDTSPSPLRAPAAQISTKKPRELRSEAQVLELDNLADQFADAVVAPSEVAGLGLDSLLDTLHGDPFSTRKQLPRTPESLILDVKSSWRKAVEEDRAQKLGRVDGGQQRAPSCTPPPPWDALEADSLGGAVGFSLVEETLPGCDSLLSLDEDEDQESLLDRRATPGQVVSASDQDWGQDSTITTEVFSLDLDGLEAPSTPQTRDYVLPSLITFSPDDMNC